MKNKLKEWFTDFLLGKENWGTCGNCENWRILNSTNNLCGPCIKKENSKKLETNVTA